MPPKDDVNQLSRLIADLEEEAVLTLVQQYAARGVDPLAIISQCHQGMAEVGRRYESGRFFISALIMAGEIMRQVGELVLPLIENRVSQKNVGRIILGTVSGDIHFIGKDIFKVLARSYGFAVNDLGVDVPPRKFLDAINEARPEIVGMCCLISSAYRSMRETIAYLKKNVPPQTAPKAYIIGGMVGQRVCKDVGADFWANDGMKGIRICQNIIGL